ncbi:MAG TPA: (4Fe-4S)-binding protein [Gemmatimonadales bacterium]|jgi:uncharacterized Fe-S cluster protein YjdI
MPKPLQVYQTKELVVTFDPNICQHSGVCLRGLPQVFDVSRPDWIRLEGAWPEEIVDVVGRCPSGALQAVRAGAAPQKPLPFPSPGVTIHATRDGPMVVKGTVTLELPTGKQEKRSGAFSLCRCGQTKSTPYCDGSHLRVGFRSPA